MNTRAWEYSDFYGMPVSISPDGNYIVIDKLTNTYSYSAADLSVIDLKSSSEIDISSLFHKEESEDEHTIFYNWRQIPMRWFIINISSRSGYSAQPGQTIYSASKYGVRGFTEVLREEVVECFFNTTEVIIKNIK